MSYHDMSNQLIEDRLSSGMTTIPQKWCGKRDPPQTSIETGYREIRKQTAVRRRIQSFALFL